KIRLGGHLGERPEIDEEHDLGLAPFLKKLVIVCNFHACGCRKAGLICSSLCTCSLGEACENVSDINLLEDRVEDEDGKPSSINNFIYEDIGDLYLQLDEEDKEQQTELEDFSPGPSKRQKLEIAYIIWFMTNDYCPSFNFCYIKLVHIFETI
ncbi:hypothetical protein AVEN_184869-1, partial [Araneus ventricosus]